MQPFTDKRKDPEMLKMEEMFSTLSIPLSEREKSYRLYNAHKRYMSAPEGSKDSQEAWKVLESITLDK